MLIDSPVSISTWLLALICFRKVKIYIKNVHLLLICGG